MNEYNSQKKIAGLKRVQENEIDSEKRLEEFYRQLNGRMIQLERPTRRRPLGVSLEWIGNWMLCRIPYRTTSLLWKTNS